MRMQWGRLSDDTLGIIEGRRQLLLGQLQEMYGVSAEEAELQVAEWERRGSPPPGVMPSRSIR